MKDDPNPSRKKFSFPDTYVLILCLLLLAAALTYLIPAGSYDRVQDLAAGREVVVPGTYHVIEQTPVSLGGLFMAIPKGMMKNAITVFFIFIIGGAFGVVNATESLHRLIARVIHRTGGSHKRAELVVVLLAAIFALAGGVIGMAEECLAFLPIMIALTIGLGFDAVVGVAIVMLGVAVGYGAAPINPFTVGLAQSIAGLPMFSGMWFRWIFWVVSVTVLCTHLVLYCRKIKKDPSRSLVADVDYSGFVISGDEQKTLTKRHVATLVVFLGGIALLMYLIIARSFYLQELVAYFFGLGILCGFVYGMTPNEIAAAFVKGMQDMVYPAILVGLASGISVIMEEGHILDTIVYGCSKALDFAPPILNGGIMMLIQSLINLAIPSGTGQAIVTMPLMAPLADVSGITRQVAVLAYQMGDGFSNSIVPTLGMLMAAISIGKITYGRWVKFIAKWLACQLVVNFIFLMIAVAIHLGPS
ncbi:MAG: Na+/H+ antiporter NhaC family protein [Oscillospiraceae bacterium]